MKLVPFIPIALEDIPDAPMWARRLIDALNNQFKQLNTVFQNNVGWDNFVSEQQSVQCESGVQFTVRMKSIKTVPTIVLPCYSSGQEITASIVGYTADRSPQVKVTNATNPTGQQTVVLRFL